MNNKPQPADWRGWRQLLEFGERLMAASSVAAQVELILATAARLLKGQVDIWLADVFFRLPGLEELTSFATSSPSKLMRFVIETGQGYPHASADGEPGPLDVVVPLVANDSLLGVLQVARGRGPAFSQLEIQALKDLALQSAIALQAALQVEIERWRVEQLSLVHKVSAQVANVLELDKLFHRVTDLVLDTFNYYYVALFTLEPDQSSLTFQASAGPKRPEADGKGRARAVLQARLGEGIIGHVAQTGTEILANDVNREPRYCHEDALPETRSEAALPLKIEDRVLGVLDVQSDQPNDFDETDVLVLRALAHSISIALEDARLYDDLRRRADQLSVVAEASRAVASILDLEELLEEVVALIHRRFGYPFVHLFTVHPGRRQVVYQAGSGARSQSMQARDLVYGLDDPRGIIPWVARRGETLLANDVTCEYRYRPSELNPTDTCAELAVPLKFADEVLGVLDVQSDRRNAFGDEDVFVLEALADNVAIAIRNANLYQSERWRRQVADSLREVAGLLSADVALDQVLEAILIELQLTLPCDAAAIWLLSDNSQVEAGTQIQLAAVRGCSLDEVSRASQHLANASSWLEEAMRAHQPTIRNFNSPSEPLGVALRFASEYSALAAPLRVGDQRLGLLTLVHRDPGRYGSESQLMTAAFASYAAVAIENTRLYEAAQEQAWISTVLLKVAEATQSLTTLDQVLETVVRLPPMLVGVDRCALFLSPTEGEGWDKTAGVFAPAASYGFSASQRAFFETWHIARGDVLAFEHLRLIKSPIVIRDASRDPRLPQDIVSTLDLRSLLMLPLLAHGDVIGAMLVDWRGGGSEFEEERLSMLQGIAHQTAAAVESAQLLEARQQEAYVSAALLQVAQAIVSFNDLDDILAAIVRITPMVVGVEWGVILTWVDGQAVFRPGAAYGIPGQKRADLLTRRYESGDFPLLDAVRESKNLMVLDSFSDWTGLMPSGFADDFVTWLRSPEVRRSSRQAKNESRSILALPLSVKDDVLGVMLVEETAPFDRFRDRRLEIMTGIAHQAALAVQNDLLQREVAEREQLDRELQLAHEIQRTFMPGQSPRLADWELAFTWRAARQLGGDFYDFFELPGQRLGLVIADVADKGVPAALFMALTRALIRAAALEDESPATVLARVNDWLLPDAQQGMFVTAAYAVLSLETGELRYAIAGHTLPLLWRFRAQELFQFEKGGTALGVLEKINLQDRFTSLERGDAVVLFTDGITEAYSREDGIYGEERFWATVRACGNASAQDMLAAIDESVAAFVGDEPPSDDVTLMVLHRLAS